MLIPKLPLISVGKNWVVGPEKNRRSYALIGDFAFYKSDYFLYHLDSNGVLYSVKSVEELPLAELSLEDRLILLSYNLFNGKGRWGWARYHYSDVHELCLDEAKAFLIEQAMRVNSRWKEHGPSIRDFKSRIASAQAHHELVSVKMALG